MQRGPTSPEMVPAAAAEEEVAAVGEEEKKDEEDQEVEEEEEVVEEEEEEGRGGRWGAARRGVVMVKRELLLRCMTCPLCHRLLRDATTVSECLHTFCRKCIYEKLNDEDLDHCPVCKIDLGCVPVEKLRADHNIQDVRSKIFPFKRKKVKAEEVESPITLPVKRKERSISSLVVNTPRVTPASLTGRRTRAVTRKAAALRGLGPIIGDPVKKENDSADRHADNPSLLDSLSKVPQTRRQVSSNAEASNHPSGKNIEGGHKESADKTELWRPLNCLVEAASRTKPLRSSLMNPAVKGELLNDTPSSANANKTKAREHLQKSKIQDDKKGVVPVPPMTMKRKAQGPGRRRRQGQASANAAPDASASQNERKLSSIWFSLIASFEQKGEPPLPQIPAHYLRIKDGNLPASSIQKYLVQKLSLSSESEVEISCCGQAVNPIQPLHNLVDRWLRAGPVQSMQTMIGSSGRDFVMVLTYGRPS